jgi:hypothetical protein
MQFEKIVVYSALIFIRAHGLFKNNPAVITSVNNALYML